MELKTNYQYTNFIYPFVVGEVRYHKYIQKLMRNKKVKIKTFQKERDILLYKYFEPKVREFLFSSFSMPHSEVMKLNDLPIETRAAIIADLPCTIFEYEINNEKTEKTNKTGIQYSVKKIEIICFKTGICFISLKTMIENSRKFSDVLNFNYKFRDIGHNLELDTNDNIEMHVKNFENTKEVMELIKELAGSSVETIKMGINTERFLTYSYVCLDGEGWNKDNTFENIKTDYIKYANMISANDSSNLQDRSITISHWKYARLGITKNATTLFTSNTEINNFTILPEEYENQYFYTYILNLYKRLYLKKINQEFKNATNSKDVHKTRKKFVNFTQTLWIQEITDDEVGNILNQKYKEVFEIETMYHKMKHKYDVIYKEMNVEKNAKRINRITIILVITLIISILNFIMQIKF